MSEPGDERAQILADLFCKSFNAGTGANFIFDHQNSGDGDYDLLMDDKKTGKKLKVQLIEAVPSRGKELVRLKGFEKSGTPAGAIHVQTDALRIEESLGRKIDAYPDASLQGDLVLLIDFGLLGWDESSLPEMRAKVKNADQHFFAVYSVHIGSNQCIKLS